MTANKRNFQQEFRDKVNGLGMPNELFEGSPITLEILCDAINPFLANMQITNEIFTLDTFKAIIAKEFNLEVTSKVLNFLVAQTATSLSMTLESFVQFQSDLRIVIKNYNGLIEPIIKEVEREAKLYEVKMNTNGEKK